MKRLILKILQNYLSSLSRFYLKKTAPNIIWVTWSVWKTSCRIIIHQILNNFLEDKKSVYSSPKNFNSELGIIFSIFQIEDFTPSFFDTLKKSVYISFKSLFKKPLYKL